MYHFYSDDGRVLTPPKELEPQLRGAYSAFYKLLGHIRFFYAADEIWDGKASLAFCAGGEPLTAITLEEGAFSINIAKENVRIVDESGLNAVFRLLENAASFNQRRPAEQLSVDLAEYPNGIRCDLCLIEKRHNENDYEGCRKFAVMDHNCYYGVKDGWGKGVFSPSYCEGKQGCYTKTYACLSKKGVSDCLACGEYHSCDACGVGHHPGECNLGITAEEVTHLIIPYCEVERLDLLRNI